MIITLINLGIKDILESRLDILPHILRKKSKFEGWLKFELASYLENSLKMSSVEIEKKNEHNNCRCDISFICNEILFRLELKTPNTNWKIGSGKSGGKPITKNVSGIIADAKKLNCPNGIVSFVMFPIPVDSDCWKNYIERITEETEINILETDYEFLNVKMDNENECRILICSFRSKIFIPKNSMVSS
jgi:hypothetical protein